MVELWLTKLVYDCEWRRQNACYQRISFAFLLMSSLIDFSFSVTLCIPCDQYSFTVSFLLGLNSSNYFHSGILSSLFNSVIANTHEASTLVAFRIKKGCHWSYYCLTINSVQ